ncbi:hypothetical protein ACVCAH_11430 [Micromonospora sp. LZ34]
MRTDLEVPAGTRLLLLAGEWFPAPGQAATVDQLVTTVAVYREVIGGLVWVRGHVCSHPNPDCGTAACFEHQVAVSAIRANLAGAR